MPKIILFIFILIFTRLLNAQGLDANNMITIVLDDGTKVNLIGKALSMEASQTIYGTNKASNEYYYLPANLRLSQKADGTPEFLFVKYTTEKDASAGGVQGALIHFLVEWGLTADQLKQAELKLKSKLGQSSSNRGWFIPSVVNQRVGEIKILGAATLLSNDGSFEIFSASLSDVKILKSGRAPVTEGAKAIVAAKMDKNVAQLFASTLDKAKSIADLSLEFRFNYVAKIPAIKGKIEIDWTSVQKYFNQFNYIKNETYSPWKNDMTTSQYDSIYSYMRESNAIKIEVDLGGNTAAEQEAALRINELFMTMFSNLISASEQRAMPSNSLEETPEAHSNATNEATKSAGSYDYVNIDMRKIANKAMSKHETIILNQRMNSTFSTVVTGNLLSWYQGVRNNQKCVYSVNLNDPFYEHRYLNFILDLDAKDIFDSEVNYVSVNVRKKRDQGNSFQDKVIIDKKYLAEKGSNVSMTYARGEDKNPDVYEYQTQWSLRGGNIFPPAPFWEKGDWAGVTLYPPVKPMNIEFEANLEQLKEMSISRVTCQIRYKKFGIEIEDNLNVSPAQGASLVNRILYADKDTRGYAYRMVFNHMTEGKLALPWSSKVNDNYVFATIPEELKDKTSPLFEAAKKLGSQITIKEGKVSTSETIIDTFKDIFNAIKK